MDGAFEHDSYLIEQLIRPIVNLYRVSAVVPGVDPGPAVAFVRQKRMKLKEDIGFYADEDQREELFRLRARRAIDIGGRYDVLDPAGVVIGTLEHVFGKSLLRSTWKVLGPQEEELAVAQEKSMVIAILRRLQDTLPLPYHFSIARDGRELGSLDRKWGIRDKYVLDLKGDVEKTIDRRLAIALAVGLDALQGR